MRFLTASDCAVLIELPDLPCTMALYRVLMAQKIAGVRELVPAARTLLVHFDAKAIGRTRLTDVLHACAAQADAVQAS
ncbi:MAG: carboxyltransferase domain-containing protein, partial [Comamonas sp.]|nr:carboxyltransferase domain-containing protein [Candidatus Comamonas equi]